MRHEPVDISVSLEFATTGTAVGDLVSSVAEEVARSPRDASVAVVDGEVSFVHSAPGRALGVNVARARIFSALDGDVTKVILPVKKVATQIPDAKLGKTIVVDPVTNLCPSTTASTSWTVRCRDGGGRVRDAGGSWTIVDKQENPTWYNPAPTPGAPTSRPSIPRGPGNPLGTRALYLHGVRDSSASTARPTTSSIGRTPRTAASGCSSATSSSSTRCSDGTRVIVF